MEDKKTKGVTKKNEVLRFTVIAVFTIIVIYMLTNIYSLIKVPTNVFVIENGKLSQEEDAIRLHNS